MLLKQWCRAQLTAMQDEISSLRASPAKYLDAALTAEPSSGVELYERYEKLLDQSRRDFQCWASRFPAETYRADRDGSLRRRDLASLERDIEAFRAVIDSTP
jgi:hypothetical protein